VPNLQPDVCVCGFLLTWAGQRRSFRSLVSPISGANLRISYHEPEYVRLYHTDGIGLGWIVQDGVECPLSGFYFSYSKSEFRADNPPTS